MGNSSSTPSSSTTTTTDGEQYDVFISFRGTDTRYGFTSHLYRALDEKGITTFIDNKLVRGEEISDGLWRAIGKSKISVVIFSENYASSEWCLLELEEIMKYKDTNNQIVIPVFYQVDPSHVENQTGSYEAAFVKHGNELQQDKVKKWRDTLTRASGLSGWDSSVARNEAEFVCDIVSDVWNKLNNICPCDFKELVKGLVGIEKPIERVVSLLCLGVPDFRIIGIWGMGGMGKTTIADAVFQLVSHQFEKTHFALCVREESEKDRSRLFRLRDEIICKVLNEKDLKIDSLSIPQSIKRRLNQKKVLIVLDDVDKLAKFEILAGGLDRFGPGSRIILTTRDKQVLHNCGVEDHNIYKVEGLNDDEALQLFYNKAFKQNNPTEDLKVLSRKVVKIARNVPLAVRVLGGSLLNKKSKQDWENAVDKFRRNVNSDVFVVLRISYDGLDKEEKGLFLDIACFVEFNFKIKKEDLELNLSSDRGFSLIGLIDKSLVTVEHGSIKMHDLLREMGREIVDKESPNKPGIRSRLWREEDVLHTLKHNDGTEAVQGIFLDIFLDVQLGSQVFMKMYNLRTLIKHRYGDQVHLCNGGLDYLPEKLKYLYWASYPLEVLPSSFNPKNLVELDLSHSKIKQLWEGSTRVPNLKWLNLVNCKDLISIPDLSNIPSAEIINLYECSSLTGIHSSRECPKNLHSLQLEGCISLSRLPSNIHLSEEPSFSTSVVLHSSREGSEFSLRGLFRLTKLPHISGSIKSLDLSSSGVEEVPSTIESLSKLERLNMGKCESLKRISESICKLKSLDRLDLTGCCKLESFPDILDGMELKYLDLSGTAIKELPPSIGNLNRLEELVWIDSILKKLSPLSGLCSLTVLKLDDSNLTEISEDIGCLSSLEMLHLRRNRNLGKLPKSIKKLSKLYHLSITFCFKLRSLPELPSSLRYLEAIYCDELIQSLPDESEIKLCAGGCGSFIFNFMNCLQLNHKAVRNLFRDSVLKIKLMGTEKIISLFKVISPPPHLPPSRFCSINTPPDEEVKVGICLPGSEIPEWFSCYKNNGSSINIPGLRNDCVRSSYIMGFEVCLVIGDVNVSSINIYKMDTFISNIDYDFHIETSDGHKEGFVRNSIQLSGDIFVIGDHILLWYNLSRKCYEFFQELDTLLANRGMSDYVGTSFEFNIRPSGDLSEHSIYKRQCEVKYCGIQPIYISGCNDTAEETCEPHPKGICTEAKDFEGFIDDNSNFNSNNNNNCKETAIEDLYLELHIGHSSFYDAHMNSVSINQNTGDTSGCNDIAEETCEPHPKRICTEANQFS